MIQSTVSAPYSGCDSGIARSESVSDANIVRFIVDMATRADVAGRGQRHPGAVAERQLGLREMDENLSGRPFAGPVTSFELRGLPLAHKRANAADRLPHGLERVAAAEILGVGCAWGHPSTLNAQRSSRNAHLSTFLRLET
jgi:hypothetical protein